jgi:hypothetical protein
VPLNFINYYVPGKDIRLRVVVSDTNVWAPLCGTQSSYGYVQRRDFRIRLINRVPLQVNWMAPAGYSDFGPASIDYYQGLPTGTYTVQGSITSALGCTVSDTVVIPILNKPTINILSKPYACDASSIVLNANGSGVDSAFMVWADDIDFSNANNYYSNGSSIIPDTSITYYVAGQDTNGCGDKVGIKFTWAPLPSISANITSTIVCQNTSITLIGTGADSLAWSNGVINNEAFVVNTANTFTLTGIDTATGCINTFTSVVDTNTSNSNLALATLNNGSSSNGTEVMNQMQPDGTTLNYVDINCNLIASVNDGSGGNILGSTNGEVNVQSTAPTDGSINFIKRWYQITPTNNGAAIITLYYTQGDFDDYNSNPSNTIKLPLSGNNTDANIANLKIYKLDGILGIDPAAIITPNSVVFDSATNYWRVQFAVASFSQFYVAANNATPLSIALQLSGKSNDNSNELTWTTTQDDIKNYEVQKLINSQFVTIANTTQKVFTDKDIAAENIYRIQAQLHNGASVLSNTISIRHNSTNAAMQVYPNPAHNELYFTYAVSQATNATIKLYDVTGKLVKQIETSFGAGIQEASIDVRDLAAGVYQVQVVGSDGLRFASKVVKE